MGDIGQAQIGVQGAGGFGDVIGIISGACDVFNRRFMWSVSMGDIGENSIVFHRPPPVRMGIGL